MKLLKRLFRILGVTLAILLLAAGVMYWMAGRRPSAYTPNLLSPEQIRDATMRMETQKLPTLQTYAAKAQADAHVSSRDKTTAPSAGALAIDFTQDELNAFLLKWSTLYRQSYEQYVTDPYIVLDEGEVVLMATVAELKKVVSAHLRPVVNESGQLKCDLAKVKLGNLPLPQRMFDKYREKLQNSLRARLPAWQTRAKVEASGASNTAAVDALLAQVVLRILDHRPAPAVLYVQVGSGRLAPVKMSEVKVEKGLLSITVTGMTAAERDELLKVIREPVKP